MNGKKRTRLAVVTALTLIVGLIAIGSVARADSTQEFTLDIEPPVVAEGNTVPLTFTIANPLSNTVNLGAFRIPVPTTPVDFGVALTEPLNVTSSAGDPWTVIYDDDGDFFEGIADSNGSRLEPGQHVFFTADVIVPPVLGNDDADTLVPWIGARAIKANSFEQGNTTNNNLDFDAQDRGSTFVFRDDGGITTQPFQTHETLVVSGEQTDCSAGPCEGEDDQADTFVVVSIPDCEAGTLIVDATGQTIFGESQTGAAAVINYLDAEDCIGFPLVIDFLFGDSVAITPGSAVFEATYGLKNISLWDPNWSDPEGDGEVLDSCSKDITLNCVEYVKGGADGVRARVIGVVTPIDGGFSAR